MAGSLTRFLGDRPLRVVIRLTIISLLVGIALRWSGFAPFEVLDIVLATGFWLFESAYDLVTQSGDYLIVGAVIVVPVFLLTRLLAYRSPRD